MPEFKDVYGERYLLPTTFTKDGKPKPTAVWGVAEGDKLLVITDDGSWYVVPQAVFRGGIGKVHAAIEVEAPAS